ncbi:MAG: hypothetical protein WCB22_29620, partial [Pseudolabrys sp.]
STFAASDYDRNSDDRGLLYAWQFDAAHRFPVTLKAKGEARFACHSKEMPATVRRPVIGHKIFVLSELHLLLGMETTS